MASAAERLITIVHTGGYGTWGPCSLCFVGGGDGWVAGDAER